jgi:hypothetical protein
MLKQIWFVLALGFFIGNANASLIEMDKGTLYTANYDYGGMGTGRGIGFNVNESFQMTFLGMKLGVKSSAVAKSYKFDIYSSVDGHTAGSLLDSKSFNLSVSEGWFDVAFNFVFKAGSSYVINFTGVDGQLNFGLGTIYSWEPSSHFNYGMLTTVEGFEGASPNKSNPLSAHFRINANAMSVSEPSSIALLSLCLAGFVMVRRTSKVSA